MVARIKEYARVQDAEHVIAELPDMLSREQVMLVGDVAGYKPGRVLAKLTAGANIGKYTKFTVGGADGAGVAKAVLMDGRKGSTGPIRAVAHVRDCDLNVKKMSFGTGATDAQKAAAIAQLVSINVTDGSGNVRVR